MSELPRVPHLLLKLLLPEEIRASAMDDIVAAYERDVRDVGLLRARLRVWKEVFATNWTALWLDEGYGGRRPRLLQDLRQDLRYGVRQLRRSPLFTAGILVTLAVGIGANTAVYSIVRGVLLRPFAYPDEDRLVTVVSEGADGGRGPVSGPDLVDWRELSRSFAALAAYAPGPVNLAGDHEPDRLLGAQVSQDMFAVFGVRAAIGRALVPDDFRPWAEKAVVLSDGFWRRGLAADSAILGRSIILNGEPHTIVGVMPRGFNAPVPWTRYQVWTPLSVESLTRDRDWRRLWVVGRLRPAADVGAAEADLRGVASRLAERYPRSNQGITPRVIPLRDAYLGDLRPPLLLVGLAAGAVLLIVCVNVAGMLLARSVERRREVAMRRALGAGRARLARQFLVESVIVCVLGGALGVLVGRLGLTASSSILAPTLPRSGEIQVDGAVLIFTALVSLGVALALGLVPLANTGSGGSRVGMRPVGGFSPASAPLRKTFVALQFAVTLLLANGAALMLRSYVAVTDVELGLNPDGVVTFTLTPEGNRYEDGPRRQEFFGQALDKIRSIPGVIAAGASSKLPLEGGSNTKVVIEGREGEFVQDEAPLIELSRVMPGYLETMQIPLRSGRVIEERDSDVGSPGIVINEAMARRLFGGEDPLGQRVSWEIEAPRWLTIVGVVGDVPQWGIEQAVVPEMYVPYSVLPRPRMFVVVRASTDPLAILPAVRTAVGTVDATLPVADVRTMDQVRAGVVAPRRVNALLVGLLASVAMVLVTAGIYGVMAHHAAQRTREMGIRMTLGANRRDAFGHVITAGMIPALVGVAVGLGSFLLLADLLGRFVFGISAADPLTLATSVTFVTLLGLLACLVPAWRAARTDLVAAVRAE